MHKIFLITVVVVFWLCIWEIAIEIVNHHTHSYRGRIIVYVGMLLFTVAVVLLHPAALEVM
jgi:hypothetical protein